MALPGVRPPFATFVGPLYVRVLITDERIDDEFIEAVFDPGLEGARGARDGQVEDSRA